MEQGRHRAPSTGGPEGPVWVRGPPGPGRAGSSHHQAVSGGNQAPADPDRPTRSQMGGDAQAESGAQGHQQGLRGGEPEEARQETHVAPPPQPAEGRVAEIPRGRRDDAVGGDVPGFLRVLPGRRTDSSTRGGVPGTGPPDSCGHSDGPRQPPSMADCLGETIQDGPAPAGCTSDGGQDGPAPMPVEAVEAFRAIRGSGKGPFFRYQDGSPLTRARLDAAIKRALGRAGADATGISTHSLRIGAATTAARRGVQDSEIRDMGRWRSSAFLRYVRKEAPDRAKLSRVLARLE